MRYEHPMLHGENCVSREERREKKNNSETSSLSEERKLYFSPSSVYFISCQESAGTT